MAASARSGHEAFNDTIQAQRAAGGSDSGAEASRAMLITLARYNVWATRQLLDSVASLSDDEYRRDVGLPFKSVHGTLNHLLVAEGAIWFRRFTEGVSPQMDLSAELESDRTRLGDKLQQSGEAWLPFLRQCSADDLTGTLRYKTMRGQAVALPFASVLMHVFNHATHHRGQMSAAISSMGHAYPVLDLVYMLQSEG